MYHKYVHGRKGWVTVLASCNQRVIVGDDFNCTTSFIPGYQTNDRGEKFELVVTQTGLTIKNNSVPTWRRGDVSSINNYILTRRTASANYQILEDKNSP